MLRGPIRHGSDRGNGQTAHVDDGGASAPIPYPVSRKASSAPPFFRAPARTRKAMMSGRFKPRSGASRLYPSCPFRVTIDLTDPNSTKPLSGPGNPQKAPSSPLRSATSSFPRTASIASSQSIRHSAQLQCCAVANRANSSFGNTTEARSQAPSTAANKAGSTRPVLAARCTSSKCAQPFSASGQSTLKSTSPAWVSKRVWRYARSAGPDPEPVGALVRKLPSGRRRHGGSTGTGSAAAAHGCANISASRAGCAVLTLSNFRLGATR